MLSQPPSPSPLTQRLPSPESPQKDLGSDSKLEPRPKRENPWKNAPPGIFVPEEEDHDMAKVMLRPTFPGTKIGDRACWERYFRQIRESQGFDIDEFPGSCAMTTLFPMACFEASADYAAQALEHYNKKHGTKYEVAKIIKVNGYCTGYFHFYITFSVTNGEEEYFQAEVVRDVDKTLEFPIVRPRVNGCSGI